MSDEQLDNEERRLADLFRQVEAPASMRRWDVGAARGAAGGAGAVSWWARPFLALFTAGGERRLRPLAAALVLPLLVLVVGGGMQLRAHFAGSGSGGDGATPPARSTAAMAFDAAHGQVVLFGGRTADGQVLGDTWTWDGSSWTQQHPRQAPSPRSNAVMAFDAAHGVVVLYGGSGGFTHGGPPSSSGQGQLQFQPQSNPTEETWTWDGSNWHQVITGHRPSGQIIGMAYDEKRNQLLLVNQSYGFASASGGGMIASPGHPVAVPPHASSGTAGSGGGSAPGQLQVVPSPVAPQPAQVHPLPANPAPLPAPVEVSPTSPVQHAPLGLQTWTWMGSDWKLLTSNQNPSGFGANGPPAWDDAAKRVVLLTSENPSIGCMVSSQWDVIQSVPAPGIVNGSAGSGATRGSAGWTGYAPLPATTSTTVTATATALPVPKPTGIPLPPTPTIAPVPHGPGPCPATPAERSVGSPTSSLHCMGCPLAHQWSWDGSAWRETRLGDVSFLGEQLAADPATGQLVAVDSSRTWTWNGSNWTPHLNPAGLRMRSSFALAADTAHHDIVLFGGRLLGDRTDTGAADTWTWNGSAWTHVAGTVPPPPVTSYLNNGAPTMVPGGSGPHATCMPTLHVVEASDESVSIIGGIPPNAVSCVGGPMATVTLLDSSGVKLGIVGNGAALPLPSGFLRWTNWCGPRKASIELRSGHSAEGQSLDYFPTCTDKSQPSRLVAVP